MPARLTVIISQSSIRHSQATDAEERLLTELMMTSGLDATLIGSLDNIQPDSTDFLCLSSFNSQTLALVSSLSFEEATQHWSRLQLGGQVVRLGQAAASVGRRVYYFSMSSSFEATMAELGQLLNDQTVKTVNVLLPLGKVASPTAARPAVNEVNVVAHTATEISNASTGTANSGMTESRTVSALPVAPLARPEAASTKAVADTEEAWPELDKLVDDFDALDL